jgi:hypothetical protein
MGAGMQGAEINAVLSEEGKEEVYVGVITRLPRRAKPRGDASRQRCYTYIYLLLPFHAQHSISGWTALTPTAVSMLHLLGQAVVSVYTTVVHYTPGRAVSPGLDERNGPLTILMPCHVASDNAKTPAREFNL